MWIIMIPNWPQAGTWAQHLFKLNWFVFLNQNSIINIRQWYEQLLCLLESIQFCTSYAARVYLCCQNSVTELPCWATLHSPFLYFVDVHARCEWTGVWKLSDLLRVLSIQQHIAMNWLPAAVIKFKLRAGSPEQPRTRCHYPTANWCWLPSPAN